MIIKLREILEATLSRLGQKSLMNGIERHARKKGITDKNKIEQLHQAVISNPDRPLSKKLMPVGSRYYEYGLKG